MAALPDHPAPPERVTKIDAARRQLATAIMLWFTGGDSVSIYTLSHAAYEVIHNITKEFRTHDLLFDSLMVRDEFRPQVNTMLREPANFFKHAKRGKAENPVLEFHPEISELFIFFAVCGLRYASISLADEERAFSIWLTIQRPNFVTEKGREFLENKLPVESINQIRRMSPGDYFHGFMEARRSVDRR